MSFHLDSSERDPRRLERDARLSDLLSLLTHTEREEWDCKVCGVSPEDSSSRCVLSAGCMEKSSPRMTGGTRDTPVNSSPAVAANAEGEEIEVLESTDVLPVAPEDVSAHEQF